MDYSAWKFNKEFIIKLLHDKYQRDTDELHIDYTYDHLPFSKKYTEWLENYIVEMSNYTHKSFDEEDGYLNVKMEM